MDPKGHLPRSGPVVIVANHPFGILESAVLATLLPQVRPDVRFLANSILSAVPEIQDLLIPVHLNLVDPISGNSAAHRNSAGLRRGIESLHSGGCLVVFPAGEVSHFQLREIAVTDSKWHTAVARMIETAARMGMAVSVVPAHIQGSNSILFQTLGLIHARFRTMLLARELLNKRNRLVELRIGSPIASKKLLEIPTPKERTEYLRWRTYLLGARPDFKARTSLALRSRERMRSIQASAPAGSAELLAREIAGLCEEQLLTRVGDFEVYVVPAHSVPRVLDEIGRLRELTFRAVGEGTGKAADLDRFDKDYSHLFLWKPATNEIVGAYRLAGTDRIRDLYTQTLFKVSRELMVTFLEKHAALQEAAREWMNLISARNPLRRSALGRIPPSAGLDIEDLSDIVADLEPTGIGIPVLLRQYLRLGGAARI